VVALVMSSAFALTRIAGGMPAARITSVPAVFCDYRAVQTATVRRLCAWLAGEREACDEAVRQRLASIDQRKALATCC